MPGRSMGPMPLVVAVAALAFAASLLGGTAGAQSEPERSTPIQVDRPDLGGLGASLAEAADNPVPGDVTVRVDYSGSESTARQSVTRAGGRILVSGGTTFKVDLPAAALRGLARAPGIVSVRELIPPAPLAVKSQGVASTNANTWHAQGLTGIGVKVAVVDFGFAGRAEAIAVGDLPGNAIIKNYCSSFDGAGSHGTGVAEIVYDVAPAAQLYLVCVDDEFDLEAFVDYAIAQKIDVINHSGAWFLSDRGDGTAGFPSASNAVRRADAAGILWVAAAGNYTQDHWKGTWNPVTIGNVTLQRFGTNSNNSPDFDLAVVVPAGGVLSVFLKWDNWPTTQEDLDLYLWTATGSTPERTSTRDQSSGDFPGEDLTYVNTTGSAQTLYIEARAFSVNKPGELDILVFGHAGIEYPVAAGSIADPAFSPHAVAVGASCFQNNQIEYFSSLGPTIDGRIKPDFVSADGVITRSFGGTSGACDGFIGTSASAPHIAGLAALIMHAAPNWTPERVVQALEDYAIDRGPVGKDNTYGFGDVVLGAVPAEDCQSVPTPVTGIAGPGTVIDTYSGSSVPAGSYLVKNNNGSLSLCVGPGTPASASAALVAVSLGDPTSSVQLRESAHCLFWIERRSAERCRPNRFGID